MKDQLLKKTTNTCFAPGPVNKVLKWKLDNNDLEARIDLSGRSHRSKEVTSLVKNISSKIRDLLNVPNDYKIVCLTGGATAAVEMAMWNLLGPKTIDLLSWEVFGDYWHDSAVNQLKLKNVNLHKAPFGEYLNMDKVDFMHNDTLFVHSGSSSGVIFIDEDKIPSNREGIVISDSTSYLFAYDMQWDKVDAVAFSWQKVIAGEAAHGMLILSPRAIKRLQEYTPSWPVPKIYRLKDNNYIIEELFDKGIFINTPSILALIDADANLNWIIKNGGISCIRKIMNTNYSIMKDWVNKTPWIEFLVKEENYRSKAIASLIMNDNKWNSMPKDQQNLANKFMIDFLGSNNIAQDIPMHVLAPALGFRIWLGYSILNSDIEVLTKWLEVAYEQMKERFYN